MNTIFDLSYVIYMHSAGKLINAILRWAGMSIFPSCSYYGSISFD